MKKIICLLMLIFTMVMMVSCSNIESKAIKDVDNFAADFETKNSNDYLTPFFVKDYLIEIKGYSEEVAIYAVYNSSVDWNYHANIYAQNFLIYIEEFGSPAYWYTSNDIQEILERDGFSNIVIDNILSNIDWNNQKALYVLHLSSFNSNWDRLNAKLDLKNAGFSTSEIENLLSNSSINWKAHALNKATALYEEYINDGINETEIIELISKELSEIWQFTNLEIEYAIENLLQ